MDKTDTDGDGLYDIFETAGMLTACGQVIYTDPLKKDTDGDGISDGEEMGVLVDNGIIFPFQDKTMYFSGDNAKIYVRYFENKSNPNNNDNDGDGIPDLEDANPKEKMKR